VEQHLGVGRRLEDRAVGFEVTADDRGVDEVAVVGDRDRPAMVPQEERLGVGGIGVPRGRVADVADRDRAGKLFDHVARKDVGDVAHSAAPDQRGALRGDDPGRFLPAVLEGIEAEVGQLGGFGVPEDADDPAHVSPLRSVADDRYLSIVAIASIGRKSPGVDGVDVPQGARGIEARGQRIRRQDS
jgi:hypothetical protein